MRIWPDAAAAEAAAAVLVLFSNHSKTKVLFVPVLKCITKFYNIIIYRYINILYKSSTWAWHVLRACSSVCPKLISSKYKVAKVKNSDGWQLSVVRHCHRSYWSPLYLTSSLPEWIVIMKTGVEAIYSVMILWPWEPSVHYKNNVKCKKTQQIFRTRIAWC